MQLHKSEQIFLLYYLPLFAVKLLNFTSDSIILQSVAVVCFLVFLLYFGRNAYPKGLFRLYTILGLYSALLFFTCGKQGILFSVIAVILMRGLNFNRIIYKKCIQFGIVVLLIACYMVRNTGDVTLRYLNGEWVEIVKRSNILFISYLAVLFLYILYVKNFHRWKILIPLIICSYVMSVYSGSRTGMVVVSLFFLMASVLNREYFKKQRVIKQLCIYSPLICMCFILILTLFYEDNDIVNILDLVLQGRIYQNFTFLNKYGISIIGQHIEENFGGSGGEFACLDSAYMDMLICEGLVFSVFWIVVTMKVIKFMWERNRMTEVAMLVTYAAYGITETFLINCFLNVSIFFYGEYLYSLPISRSK